MKVNFRGKKVAVLGLGLEGKDLVRFLLEKKADVTVFDQKEENLLDFGDIDKKKLKLVCGEDYLRKGFKGFTIIYRSPGVYRNIPELIKAEKQGIEISSAIKLFFDLCPAKIIGVTGTKGKGTTSTLIYEILKKSGKSVYLSGNIGKPWLELLKVLKKDDWIVLELSSFQLIDLEISPHISVILNITTDHLDWHKDRKEYIEAKSQIVRHQTKNDFAVVNYDYITPRKFAKYTKGKILYFSRSKKVDGCNVKNDEIRLNTKGKDVSVGKTKELLLRGEHNWENITAAICASYSAGASLSAIKSTVFSFKGLEHRLELVDTVKGITFYNDSFATGPQPTIAAIHSFKAPITIILGGSDKGLDYTEMGEEIENVGNVKNTILIGDMAERIKEALIKAKYQGNIIDLGKPKMDFIVKKAFELTKPGGVVVLSPAAASFDMFKDYKDRGNQFKLAVRALSK
jgi:UDP-N-acetylmuramoylalanine--D-glutamate ligase